MNALLQHWSADPFEIIVALTVIIHQRGLRARLRAMRRSGRPTRPWIQQAALFYAGLAVLILAITSPIDYWTSQYLSFHIIQHLMLSFFAPPLIVLGAPWLPLLRGLPKPARRALGTLMQRTRTGPSGPRGKVTELLARVRWLAARPLTSVVLFNATMLFWHFPGPFDLAESNQSVHIWLEHSSFFLFAVALWLQVFGSYPLRPVLDGPHRIAVLISTNAVMVLTAMTLVLFTQHLYPAYAIGHTLAERTADQQIGGSILWVCGEFSFMPAIFHTVVSWLDSNAAGEATVLNWSRRSEPVGARRP